MDPSPCITAILREIETRASSDLHLCLAGTHVSTDCPSAEQNDSWTTSSSIRRQCDFSPSMMPFLTKGSPGEPLQGITLPQ